MSSFFLTTAIDFVNSRPHLGTAYEKVTADVIARYHRLKGDDTWFLMGNDEHSQNVFRRAQEQGKDPLAYCDEMEHVFREVWRGLDISFDDFIRTTDQKRHFPAVQKLVQACLDNGDVYEGTYEGPVLRQLRGVQAGEGPRRRPVPDSQDQAGVDPREELVLPALEVPAAAPEVLRRTPVVHRAGGAAQRGAAAGRGRPRRSLHQPRRAIVGHSAAERPEERRVRVVRRAHQLRGCRWLRLERGAVREAVAGGPPHRGEGHHAVPLRHLARHADECRRGAAPAGVRPRLGVLQGRAHEQDDGEHRRSARRREAVRPGSAAPVSHQGDSLRRRRGLHVGALCGEIQRGPGEQPREPGEPRGGDVGAFPPGPGERVGRRPPCVDCQRRGTGVSRAQWTAWRCTRGWRPPIG